MLVYAECLVECLERHSVSDDMYVITCVQDRSCRRHRHLPVAVSYLDHINSVFSSPVELLYRLSLIRSARRNVPAEDAVILVEPVLPLSCASALLHRLLIQVRKESCLELQIVCRYEFRPRYQENAQRNKKYDYQVVYVEERFHRDQCYKLQNNYF